MTSRQAEISPKPRMRLFCGDAADGIGDSDEQLIRTLHPNGTQGVVEPVR